MQAKGQGQTASQTVGETGTVGQAGAIGPDGKRIQQQGAKASVKGQKQSQSQGNGAAAGDAGAAEGVAQNAQTSNVNTDAQGTSVNSGSIGQASGKGLHVSGAATAGGSSQNQAANQLDLTFMNNFGALSRSNGGFQPMNFNAPRKY